MKTTRIILAILCFILLCAFTGCGKTDPAFGKIVSAQVPAFWNFGDEPPVRITELDTDDYGRILFKAEKTDYFYSNKYLCGYFICQEKDSETGWYIPDVCYELIFDGDLPKDRMDDLKARNGWNTEPDETAWKPGAEWYIGGINDADLEPFFLSETGLNKGNFHNCYLGKDGNGLMLTEAVYRSYEEGSESELYIIVLNDSLEIIYIKKVDDYLRIADEIVSAKQAAGWKEQL